MLERQRIECDRCGWGWLAVVSLGLWPAIVWGTQAAAVGTLHVEGQGIARLVLQGNAGQSRTFEHPDPNLVLPEGDYRIEYITLEGGLVCFRSQIPADQQGVKIRVGAPATLNLGAPLRQAVEIERRGTVMILNYKLLGRRGETYAIQTTERSKGPAFTACKGPWRVFSAQFAFG